MKHRSTGYIGRIILPIVFTALLQACGSDSGSKEDDTKPVAVLTSLNGGEEVIGRYSITWGMLEANRSKVDIYISSDAGTNWVLMEQDTPDTGQYDWDSNIVDDCKNCRIRVVPTDVVGNIGEPTDSLADFEVNNIPNLLGAALFYDVDTNGIDEGDKIVVQFDKNIDVFTANVSDIFALPVLGDFVGLTPYINTTSNFSKIELVIDGVNPDKDLHLHTKGVFSKQRTKPTSPSGLVLRSDIAGLIVASDTGRSAKPLSSIDIFPAYSKQAELSFGANLSQDIALADFDNDTYLDIVSIDIAVPPVTTNGTNLWRGNGDGSFDSINVLDNINNNDDATSIVVGDIDNDGDLDLVIGLSNNVANQVRENQLVESVGLALFDFQGPNLVLPGGNHSTDAVALGDLDDDGYLDLVTGNTDFANLVWINNRNGSFDYDNIQAHTLGNSTTRAIKLADIDDDDDLDIIAGNDATTDKIWLNDGNGIFTDSGQQLGVAATYALATGDVDDDGDIDYVAGIRDGANQLWLNNGVGVFINSGQSLGQANTNRTRAILLVDVDDDGDLDLISGAEDQPNRVWFNDGNGIFTDTGQSLGTNATHAFAVGDIDRDGDLDLVEANNGQANRIWVNPVMIPPYIQFPQDINNNDTQSIALGDIDGDGDLDLVEGNKSQFSRVYLNDRSVFRDSFQLLAGGNTSKVLLGDIDNDNDLDLVIANSAGASNASLVYLNDSAGNFANTGQFGNSNTQTAALGDVDDDGDLDLVTGNDASSANKVWLNNGGVFTDSGQILSMGDTQDMVMHDLDNDGDLDLVFATTSGSETWINNLNNIPGEKGVFSLSLTAATLGGNIRAITVGDLNGDFRPDLALGFSGFGRTALNNPPALQPDPNGGSGYRDCSDRDIFEFCGDDQVNISGASSSMALSDFDNDGDLDWLLAYDNANKVSKIVFNDARGNEKGDRPFNNPERSLDLGDANDTRAIAVGDIDGDGDMDIVEGNFGTANSILFNEL